MPDAAISTRSPSGLTVWLRRYPLLSYFLIAYGFTWLWILVFLVALGIPLATWTNVPVILGPTVAGFIMTYVMQGKPGVIHFLRRFIFWRVPFLWYLVALLLPVLLLNLGLAVLPGALFTFTFPAAETLQGFPVFFILVLAIGGPLLEEPGWRGFALSRLQAKWGPLVGTLVLGVLWTFWHFPLFLLPVWAAQNGGFTLPSVLLYIGSVVPFTILFTWLFNHTRGSLLLAILFHTAINTLGAFILFQADPTLGGVLAFSIAAVIVVVATRGRLGYDTFLQDEAQGLT